ncbi:MAG: MogA/MoaB family molybdenum cofactor biosynthesis protein [Thermoleophilia bacterium]
MGFTAAVITVSDKGSRGEREDTAGDALAALLAEAGAVSVARMTVPDERERIAAALLEHAGPARVDLVITTGGTGFAPRDVTPEATREVIDREAPGIAEAVRAESLRITPRAMLSRAVCGIRGDTLIINFPGSEKACRESFAVIEPALSHALELLRGDSGDCATRIRPDC